MIPFRAPVEDILFSLKHVGRAGSLQGYDGELHAEIANHFATFAEAVLAPLNRPGDLLGARLENGRVRLPDGFRAAFDAYREQGWPGLAVPAEYGGQGLGALALGITSEIFTGANHALEMVTGLVPGAVRTLLEFGSAEQKARNIPPLVEGRWLSTMALTEPDAGSDLSQIKCRAVQSHHKWTIAGEKVFISGGDQDLSEGILHLVLARSGDEGVKGLSLFLVRSQCKDGTRNSIQVTRLEEKLGIHASPTCQLRFDGAEAELIGAEGEGLRAMFTMMNHARLAVALQGAAHAARASHIARSYAAGRVQGQATAIDRHPDVVRMLDEIDLRALGARGIAHLALVALEKGDAPNLVDALTSIAKFFCTEAASEAADVGIQVLGGYGYLEEYGMAQIWRDSRVCRIYEGTNGIHALTLVTRLMGQEAPLAELDRLAGETDGIGEIHGAWRDAWQGLREARERLHLADVFMRLTAEMVHQVVWARIAVAAEAHPDPERIARLARRARTRVATQIVRYRAEAAIYQAD